MNVLRLKDASVTLNPIAPAGGAILAAASMAAVALKRDLIISCGTEAHGPSDPHTLGEAFDFRTMDLTEGQILALVTRLRDLLGPRFTVLYEVPRLPSGVLASLAFVNPSATAPHLHVQRKKQTVYPPEG